MEDGRTNNISWTVNARKRYEIRLAPEPQSREVLEGCGDVGCALVQCSAGTSSRDWS
jgi:hypothetical protein